VRGACCLRLLPAPAAAPAALCSLARFTNANCLLLHVALRRDVGELWKKGGGSRIGGRRNWKKRQFILQGDSLTYFAPHARGKGKKLGEITLDGAVVSRVHGDPKHMHRFHVREGAGGPSAGAAHGSAGSGRTFDLRAHSEEEMNAWCDAVQNTIERCSGDHVIAANVAKSMSDMDSQQGAGGGGGGPTML